MNITEAWTNFEKHSSRLSDALRKSAIGIVVIVWTFSSDDGTPADLPPSFVLAGCLVALGLLLDIAQYASLTLLWQLFSRGKDRELEERFPNNVAAQKEAEFVAWDRINTLGIWCFWLKCSSILGGGIALFWHLAATYIDIQISGTDFIPFR